VSTFRNINVGPLELSQPFVSSSSFCVWYLIIRPAINDSDVVVSVVVLERWALIFGSPAR
jgi:hypothetical protein